MNDDYSTDSNNDFESLFDGRDSISRGEAKRMVTEEVSKTLRDIATFNAQAVAGQQSAIREVSSRHPDFEQMRPKMLSVLAEIPLLRDAIGSAENNPQLAPALPEMYEVAYRAAKGSADNTATAESSKSGVSENGRPDLSDESVQHQAALASQKIDLSPERRKSLIAELEKRGVDLIEF